FQRLRGGPGCGLAIRRGAILRTGARLLLDEITEGLAPVIVKTLARAITELKTRGYTIVLIEQNFRFAAPLADRHYDDFLAREKPAFKVEILAADHQNKADIAANKAREWIEREKVDTVTELVTTSV